MSPGEYAQLALSSVVSAAVKDGIALVVIAVSPDGATHLTTNAADRNDIPRILCAALEANADPDWTGSKPLPSKA
jgi:hypothetical protein